MTNYNHLIRDERDTIQYMLDKGHTFTSISIAIKKDRTTINLLPLKDEPTLLEEWKEIWDDFASIKTNIKKKFKVIKFKR